MKLLLDTHVLLWAAGFREAGSSRLSPEAVCLIRDPGNIVLFSAASIWEITIKHGLGRDDFKADPHVLRRGLVDNGYVQLPIQAEHALAVASLPHHHKDPFDRILIAQATIEGVTLLTSDPVVAAYPGPILKI